MNNAKWIIICKIIQSLMQLIIGMFSARYLGPANYGLINYAASILAFTMPFMKLGFDAILVHELVESPEKEPQIVGTSLLLNILSSLVCMACVSALVSVVNRNEPVTIAVCVIYSISLFFAAMEMIQYWFQYKLMSKYSSMVMLGSYVVVSAYKLFLLITEKSVYWFALAHSVEYGTIAVSLIFIYLKKGNRFAINSSIAKKMLAKGKYYILASLMVIIIQNTDHIMLTTMKGTAENGLYSAAITCITVVQFVYLAIVDSFRPIIFASKKINQEEFNQGISRLYCIIFYMAVAQCIVFFLGAKLIVWILYGREYMGAVPLVRILAVFYIFSAIGLVRNIWILAESKNKYLWRINMSGASLNIVLNFLMIPTWGAAGAAFASFLTQFFTNFVLGFVFAPIRENNRLMLKGIAPANFMKELKNIRDFI